MAVRAAGEALYFKSVLGWLFRMAGGRVSDGIEGLSGMRVLVRFDRSISGELAKQIVACRESRRDAA
jgi:hypothetical protein